jgi:hypothetical protein
VFTDGSRVEGKELSGWSSGRERLKLDGTELFGSARSLRWLRDRELQPAELPSDLPTFVEFVNGDRLPGEVARYEELQADDGFGGRGHLIVRLPAPLKRPGSSDTVQLRVLPRFIRRIVWKTTRERPFPPSTLVYRDGREASFRALRWQQEGVEVLVQEGIRQIGFAEVAEVVLPRADFWESYCEELARTNPDLSAPFLRLKTNEGMIVTTAEGACRRCGKEQERGNWHYLLRPAWSLDPIPVEFSVVRTRWYFAAHEWPLWRCGPVRAVEHPILGEGRRWQADRNVRGGPLRSKTEDHGWGFGVHAPYELWFEVPCHAQAFRTRVGLDALARDGGCARALVYLNKCEGTPLYRSDLLIGSSVVADTGNLALPLAADRPQALVLVADAAAREGPRGADPLNIRDMLDWIEPMFLLNAELLKADVRTRMEAPLANDGWTVRVEGGVAPRWRIGFEEIEPGLTEPFRGLWTGGRPLTLARQREIPAAADGLLLSLRQASGGSPGRLEVRVDGRAAARCKLPSRFQTLPLFVSLKPYGGRKVNLEVVYQPGSGSELLDLQSLAWARRADLSLWKPAEAVDAWSLFRGQPEVQADGTVRIGRFRADADIEVLRAESELRQVRGVAVQFIPEGEVFQPGEAGDVLTLGVSMAVTPKQPEPVPGRYVRIEVPPEAKYPLRLYVIEVYRDSIFPPSREKDLKAGAKDPRAKSEKPRPAPLNMARRGIASQSSVDSNCGAQRAIDGSGGRCSRTRWADDGDEHPWWEVDLGEMKPIDRIVVAKEAEVWKGRPYWVSVLDDRRNMVWRTYVDSLVHTEDLPVMPSKEVLVGPRPAAGAHPGGERAKPGTTYSPTYWSTRRPGSCEPLFFFPEKPIALLDKESLLVTLKQVGRRGGQLFGHFRLWVTADPSPRGADAAAVEVPPLP